MNQNDSFLRCVYLNKLQQVGSLPVRYLRYDEINSNDWINWACPSEEYSNSDEESL